MKELYGTVTQIEEEALFIINYRTDITTNYTVRYKGVEYETTRIDMFKSYKQDLTLYCKWKE